MKIFSDLFGFRLFYNCQKLDKLLMLHKVAGEFRSDYFPFVKKSLQIIKKRDANCKNKFTNRKKGEPEAIRQKIP